MGGIILAAVRVDITMWLERYLIVVASLSVPLMPYDPAAYIPTWVEWSITSAAFAGFTLIITLFTRLFPVVSVWEVKEQDEHEIVSAPIRPPELVGARPELAAGADL